MGWDGRKGTNSAVQNSSVLHCNVLFSLILPYSLQLYLLHAVACLTNALLHAATRCYTLLHTAIYFYSVTCLTYVLQSILCRHVLVRSDGSCFALHHHLLGQAEILPTLPVCV